MRLLPCLPSRTSIRWWNAIAKRRFSRCVLRKESESYRSRRLQAGSCRARLRHRSSSASMTCGNSSPNYRKRISRPTSPYLICCIGSPWRRRLPTPRYRSRGCSINIPMSYLFPVPRIRKGFWRIWGLGTSRFPMMNSSSYNQHWMNVRCTDIVDAWKQNRRVSVNNGVKEQISESSHIQSG